MLANTENLLFIGLLFILRLTSVLLVKYSINKFLINKISICTKLTPQKQITREKKSLFLGFILDSVVFYVAIYFGVISLNNSFKIIQLFYLLVLHITLTEFIYYWYHRLLHTKILMKNHHIYHHYSIATNPFTSFTFTIFERLTYSLLFSLPVVILSKFEMISYTSALIYTLLFDLCNILGHLNKEIFPSFYSNSKLWYFFYTPTYHANHHTKFVKNYCLFVPLYDYIFGTYEATTKEQFNSLTKKENI